MNGAPPSLLSRKRFRLPGSLAARGLLLLLLTAAVVGAAAAGVVHLLVRDQRVRHYDSVAPLLGVALQSFLERQAELDIAPPEALNAIAASAERVRWAGVFAADGTGVEFRRRATIPREAVLAQIDFAATAPGYRPVVVQGQVLENYQLVTVPQANGRVLAAIVESPATAGLRTPLGLFLCGVGAVVGLALAAAFLRVAVLQPLASSVRRIAQLQADTLDTSFDSGTPAELAGLARSAEALARELRQARGEANALRSTVQNQVQSKTRKVELALERAARQADTDPLTKLLNRRALERELPDLIEQARAQRSELAAAVIDVDHFKVFNDTHGHQAGDELLAFVGELIRGCTRRGLDLGIRYGGDEFVLLLPDTPVSRATEITRRLVALFGQRAQTFPQCQPPVALSAGLAGVLENSPDTPDALLKLADAAMYRAKRTSGRVAIAPPGINHPPPRR